MANNRPGWFEGLIGLRGAAGETTTRETSKVGLETKVGIQAAQALTLAFVAVPGTALGAYWTVRGIARLLGFDLTGLDALLGLTLISVGAVAVRRAFGGEGIVKALVGWLLAALGVMLAVFLWATARRDPDPWTVAALLAGPGMLYGFSLLAYNMTMHLREPYGFESPFEKRYLELYEEQMLGDEPEEQRIIVEVRTDKGEYVTDSGALGLDPERLATFARELERCGWDLAESRWGTHSPVFRSYAEYRATKKAMESHGLIRRVNPRARNSPYEMTRGGMAAMRAVAHAHTHARGDFNVGGERK